MMEGDPVVLRVRLTPKAARNAVQGWAQNADGVPILKVSVTAAPEGGKANDALIKLLSGHYNLPKSAFSLKSGATDRNKVLLVYSTTIDLSGP
ncbi:MAG: DUF167 domain-containing protein [Micavibrio aeruginosavorus]|nr:DUF167 domain-containing protein [Micavibrio aeruginosavorus]